MGRLLLLEDDEAVVTAIMRFTAGRYRVVVAPSCTAALASTGEFDCGIFDILLPDGSGLDVAERLLSEGRVQHAIFFSCTTDERLWVRAEQGGVFVPKSEGIAILMAQVMQVVPPRW